MRYDRNLIERIKADFECKSEAELYYILDSREEERWTDEALVAASEELLSRVKLVSSDLRVLAEDSASHHSMGPEIPAYNRGASRCAGLGIMLFGFLLCVWALDEAANNGKFNLKYSLFGPISIFGGLGIAIVGADFRVRRHSWLLEFFAFLGLVVGIAYAAFLQSGGRLFLPFQL